jgi:hypothetical protein
MWMVTPYIDIRTCVTPRPGQVWQKLNVGTKTASKAPRVIVVAVFERTVSVRFPGGTVKAMRITTLQRDWHCLNPEIS